MASPRGILPSLLAAQVRNTAAWAFAENAQTSWIRALEGAPALDATYTRADTRSEWLRVMLAAHQTSVATFVPTDVDTQIRFHVWQAIRGSDELRAAGDVVEEAAAWDPRPVSARTVDLGADGPMSGHAGEWLSVRAGALGRALKLGCADEVERQAAGIDAELDRSARALRRALAPKSGAERDALCIIVTVAHNLGDLSRVVEDWPEGTPRADEFKARYVRLGHDDPRRFEGVFRLGGDVNKAVMAVESHRYLPLRQPRALREGRHLLLPFPPWLDTWAARLAKTMEPDALGTVAAALLEGHDQYPKQTAWARALRGIDGNSPGGLPRLLPMVPARLRKLTQAGPVRELMSVDSERFEARMAKALRNAIETARAGLGLKEAARAGLKGTVRAS